MGILEPHRYMNGLQTVSLRRIREEFDQEDLVAGDRLEDSSSSKVLCPFST
jgi:hypothetical protein